MKKAIIVIIILLSALLALNLLFPSKKKVSNIKELQIIPFLFDESITDPNDGKQGTDFVFEPLELNKVRFLAPVVNAEMWNHSIRLIFEGGTIEIISDNNDVSLSVGEHGEAWIDGSQCDNRIHGFSQRVVSGTYVAACPFTSDSGSCYRTFPDGSPVPEIEGYTGREFYITVIAYEFSNENRPIVTAKLRLIQLEDRGPNCRKDRSNLFSIELISYEYNDAYKMMEDLYK